MPQVRLYTVEDDGADAQQYRHKPIPTPAGTIMALQAPEPGLVLRQDRPGQPLLERTPIIVRSGDYIVAQGGQISVMKQEEFELTYELDV